MIFYLVMILFIAIWLCGVFLYSKILEDIFTKRFDDAEKRLKSAVSQEDYERFFKGIKNDRLTSQVSRRMISWQVSHHIEDGKKLFERIK